MKTQADLQRKTSWIPLIAVMVVSVVAVVLYLQMREGVGEPPERIPTRFAMPAEFTGGVKVYYEVEGAAPLARENGFRVVRVPPSGVVLTSSELLFGRAHDEFVRVEVDGEREVLGYHYIRDRKSGLTGDGKEYFLRPEELAQRDTELVRHGIVAGPDGLPRYDVPYELFTVRDDF